MPDFIERDAQEVFEEEFLEFAGYNSAAPCPMLAMVVSGAHVSLFMRRCLES